MHIQGHLILRNGSSVAASLKKVRRGEGGREGGKGGREGREGGREERGRKIKGKG